MVHEVGHVLRLKVLLRLVRVHDKVPPTLVPVHGTWRTEKYVVVVYRVTIVAIEHGLLKNFWPFGIRLRSTHCRGFNY